VRNGCRRGRMQQALLVADIGGTDLSHEDSKQNRGCSTLGNGERVEMRLGYCLVLEAVRLRRNIDVRCASSG
jgi:hypothetical protein